MGVPAVQVAPVGICDVSGTTPSLVAKKFASVFNEVDSCDKSACESAERNDGTNAASRDATATGILKSPTAFAAATSGCAHDAGGPFGSNHTSACAESASDETSGSAHGSSYVPDPVTE